MQRVKEYMHATSAPEYPKQVTGGRSWLAGYQLLNVALLRFTACCTLPMLKSRDAIS